MAKFHNFNTHSGHPNLSRIKTAEQRKPRQQELKHSTLLTINSKTKRIIQQHAEEMAYDDQALTTEFLVGITGCRLEDGRKKS